MLKNSGKTFTSFTEEIGPDGCLYRITTVYAVRKAPGKPRRHISESRKRVATAAMMHVRGLLLAKTLHMFEGAP